MKKYLCCLFLVFLFTSVLNAQDTFFTAFWNVENLFDTEDQPDVDDAEFTPRSEKKWDADKFRHKVISLSSVIMSMNRGRGPDLLGMCELENHAVVESLLVYLTPAYRIVHVESPDLRGIDNALIFRQDKFILLDITSDTIDLGEEKTRNIIGGRLLTIQGDTISVFVNHWPSRRGGYETEGKRIKAAVTLNKRMNNTPGFIIAMGDFNDEPENISVDSVLNSGPSGSGDKYRNLAYEVSLRGEGSYKYRDTWNMLDQMIITENMKGISYIEGSFEIYKPEFMITKSGSYAGTPRPTFGGNRYLGGYSDHFPVTAQFTTGTE